MTDASSVIEIDAARQPEVGNLEDSGTVTISTGLISGLEDTELDDTLPLLEEPYSVPSPIDNSLESFVQSERVKKILVVHRADNIEQLLEEMAHQKLIQEPAFVIEQWHYVLAPMKTELLDITAAYDELQPTSRKVMKSIAYPATMNVQQKHTGRYLSTFLREADKQHLSLFLRFCTGSDLFLGKNITISFTQLEGFQRRPIAHTCGCYLELPVNYDNYPEFRHEMNKVLESNIWVMDIV
ncbi:hypothetical protein ABG768_011355 [Culter alburnus]|uniref:HECT domain-containing protein n=1 Tax=Culter alburnus TaxID=194366 RepID=A0AAW1ZAN3_CULAL